MELVIKSVHSPSIFVEVVELGIALLEGGNPIIQKSMITKLMGGDLSQSFFKVCTCGCDDLFFLLRGENMFNVGILL